MKTTVLLIFTACIVVSCGTSKQSMSSEKTDKVAIVKQNALRNDKLLIVYYDTGVGCKPLIEAAKKYGSEIIYQYSTINAIALTVPDNMNINEAIIYYQNTKGVLQVSRDQINHLD